MSKLSCHYTIIVIKSHYPGAGMVAGPDDTCMGNFFTRTCIDVIASPVGITKVKTRKKEKSDAHAIFLFLNVILTL